LEFGTLEAVRTFDHNNHNKNQARNKNKALVVFSIRFIHRGALGESSLNGPFGHDIGHKSIGRNTHNNKALVAHSIGITYLRALGRCSLNNNCGRYITVVAKQFGRSDVLVDN
jgi:hypothetical protein